MLKTPGDAGVPPSTCVVMLKVTPPGSAPLSENVGTGNPVDVTVKLPALPTRNAVAFALVIDGASLTVSVKLCAAVSTAFVALNVTAYWRPVPAAGVPERTPVAALNVTPVGSA